MARVFIFGPERFYKERLKLSVRCRTWKVRKRLNIACESAIFRRRTGFPRRRFIKIEQNTFFGHGAEATTPISLGLILITADCIKTSRRSQSVCKKPGLSCTRRRSEWSFRYVIHDEGIGVSVPGDHVHHRRRPFRHSVSAFYVEHEIAAERGQLAAQVPRRRIMMASSRPRTLKGFHCELHDEDVAVSGRADHAHHPYWTLRRAVLFLILRQQRCGPDVTPAVTSQAAASS